MLSQAMFPYILLTSGFVFTLGALGVLIRRNPLVVFMSIELMLNSVNLLLVGYSRFLDSQEGQVFAFMVIVVAAAEVVVGLALMTRVFRIGRELDVDDLDDEQLSSQTATVLAALVLLLPLLGSALCGLAGPALGRRFVNWAGTVSIGAAFVVTLVMLAQVLGAPSGQQSVTVTLWNWLDLGSGNLNVSVDVTIDALSVLMLLVITGVGFLIHVYSVGYMEHNSGVARFFSYMNFFIFSMALLVLAANLVILIIGWAAVALSSYLLIGFWHDRPSAVVAARKAMITQVIGDVALVIAAFLIFVNLAGPTCPLGEHCPPLPAPHHLYTLDLPQIFANATPWARAAPC